MEPLESTALHMLVRQIGLLLSAFPLRRGERGNPRAMYDELKGVADLKADEVQILRQQVNAFDFAEIESEITKDTVRDVESRITDLNERRYEIDQERSEIECALETEFGFDLEAIRSIFDEAGAVPLAY